MPREILIPDYWLAVRTQLGDDDVVARFRTYMPTESAKRRFPVMMIIRWPYTEKKDGMPRKPELQRMSDFEDILERKIEKPVVGIQAACVTGAGRRTWRYYVADPEAYLRALGPILKNHAPSTTTVRRVDDPEWSGLSELIPLGQCANIEA